MDEKPEDEGSGEYVCGECGRSFDSEAALEEHVRSVGLVE